MTHHQLVNLIKQKQSFLCVGLDTDISKIPPHLLKEKDPVFSFNKAIVDATFQYAVAYKPNLAFYEALGTKGWESLGKTVDYIRSLNQPIFLIADAKRGDIGNTSAMYAKTFFETMDFDAVTLSPYMGYDTVAPFLEYHNKWSILLALTSNTSADDFQFFENGKGKKLYEKVLETSLTWKGNEQLMYVVGATKAAALADIRKIIPNHFLLIPGLGVQGGNLQEVAKCGLNKQCGLFINSSRGIIYASDKTDFARAAAQKAKEIQKEMAEILKKIFVF
ncbi:MAG: orotidine-5'-phosphate decarboxylase [Bacteroidetes bacterium]|nr:MAG: orotidine-5'-phosphate decarboxylase [Bacteroidota bacterium]